MRATGANALQSGPKEIAENLRSYRKSAQVLSSSRAKLIDKYSKRWVAIHKGKFVGSASTLQRLLKETDKAGIPRGQILVRHIAKNVRKLIL